MKCSLRTAIRQTLLVAAGVSLLAQAAVAAPTIAAKVKIEEGGIYQIVHNEETDSVYVAVPGGEGSVVVLDDETLAVKDRIDVSQAPVFGLGLNKETQILYGTATRGEQLVAVDLAKGSVIAALSHGENGHVREIAIDEDRNLIYVSVVGQRRGANPDAPPSEVWVIDGETHQMSHVISDPTQTIIGIGINDDGDRIYVTDMNLHHIVEIDTESREILNTWPSGGEAPMNVVHDEDSNRLFVANQGSGTLTVLNATTGELLKSVATGEGALGVAFNERANQIYVTNRRAGTTSVVDGTSYEILANLETGTFPQTVVVNEDDNLVYVTNKARGLPRNAPPDAEPVIDDNGDTVVIIRP